MEKQKKREGNKIKEKEKFKWQSLGKVCGKNVLNERYFDYGFKNSFEWKKLWK